MLDPVNSATMAPITENVLETFRPENMAGSAFGNTIFCKTSRLDAEKLFIKSMASFSKLFSPCTDVTSIGKKEIIEARTTLDVKPVPNQILIKNHINNDQPI